ncbi:MAG TPA: response regulator transcription factor [Longilinea sp.]|nr:response regulator transcription factor [Longilinea sp.]
MKILVIDDDPAMTELLKLLLEPTQADLLTSNSGEEGIRLVKEQTPDIVVLDLMMPKVDGWQVCKAIREFSSMPILVLSALDSPGVVATALDAGADDYLIKPVPSGVLIAHINNLLKRKRPEMNVKSKETTV